MNNKYLYWIVFVAINGGLIFGLNLSGVAGANDMIKDTFRLSESQLGSVVALLTVGCLFGSLFTGGLADKFGRKKTMQLIAITFTLGAIGCAISTSPIMLSIFRFLSGLAVGASSVVTPMYISEISPASKRGRLVSLNQFAITIGILLAYIFDYLFMGLGQNNWRYMLAVPAAFGIIYFIFTNINFPESPRWLLTNGEKDKAKAILKKLGVSFSEENGQIETEIAIEAEKNKHKPSVKDLFRGKTGRVVMIGTVLAAFQQITGNNAVIMYGPDIFKAAGVGGDMALTNSILIGLVNVFTTLIAIWLVDKLGRKTLLLWGAAGMSASFAYLTYAYSFPTNERNSIGILIALLIYISCFAASFAPIMWVIISEIYPAHIKGLAMSFSTAISWLGTFLTVQFTPIINSIGTMWLFVIFGIFSILAFIFVKIYIPETKGKTLEQIEKQLGLS